MTIKFSMAGRQDADLLLSWRNDPLTVANFRNNRPVTAEEHKAWFEKRIGGGDHVTGPEHIIYIAYDDLVPIGTVQFDKLDNKPDAYETSVTVAPEARGKGYGGQILKAVCDDFTYSTLYTEIKFDNKASMKSFAAAGFVQIGSYGLWTQWRRMPLQ